MGEGPIRVKSSVGTETQALWLGGDGDYGGAAPEGCVVAVRAGFRVLWWLTPSERCSFLPVAWVGISEVPWERGVK